MIRRLWPRSLQGQMLLSVALALLLAQAIGATLIYREQAERRQAMLVHTAALRIFATLRGGDVLAPRHAAHGRFAADPLEGLRALRPQVLPTSPRRPDEQRLSEPEEELREMLTAQGLEIADVTVFARDIASDPDALRRIERRRSFTGTHDRPVPTRMVVAAVQRDKDGEWISVRVLIPRGEGRPLLNLILQTLLIYVLLFATIALILRRITRPLAALTGRVEQFAASRDTAGQLPPQGPEDVRRLIVAHNALEDRIAALLDEKDVMLGAIGHDLKTPLAALRVRIESVSDPAERAKMAATVEDITRSLDDILSLARVGRPSDPLESVELSALVAAVTEEFEDMGKPVDYAGGPRLVLRARATWLRRALRNLIENALRYGEVARVSLEREGATVAIRIDDDGPGIPAADLARMLEPFTRGDPSRNSATGGAGLGLTLARAIAEQHGGTLTLANRSGADGAVAGLSATLRLPLT